MATKNRTPETNDVEVTVVAPAGAADAFERATKTGHSPRLTPALLQPELMSVKQVAEALGLSLSSVTHHVKQGHIAAVTVGTASILLRWSVEAFQQARAEVSNAMAEEKELRRKLALLVADRKKKGEEGDELAPKTEEE